MDHVKIASLEDIDLERARRVEIYRKQIEVINDHDSARAANSRQGPYPKRVFCRELNHTFPSIQAAATFIKTGRASLKSAIRRSKGRCKGLTFELVDEPQNRLRTGRERPVRCLTDDIAFGSLTEAVKHGKVGLSTLCEALKAAQGKPARCGNRLWLYVEKDLVPSATAA